MIKNMHYKKKSFFFILFIFFSRQVLGSDYFNPSFIEGNEGNEINLQPFYDKGGQIPGKYRVDIYLNNNKVSVNDVLFKKKNNGNLYPCLNLNELNSWGVITEKYSKLINNDENCFNIEKIPQASTEFKFNKQQLFLTVPQIYLNKNPHGFVDPKLWDDGIIAFRLNYNISGSETKSKNTKNEDSSSQYISLQPGINLGPWRFRNLTTWIRSNYKKNDQKTKWNNVYNYISRDIKSIDSQLLLGDSSSNSDVFDSVPFRGLQISSDEDMIPESLRGYAPIIKGIAKSNAKVTVRQNGYVVYETYVSPGNFEINDIYPTGGAGNLYVTIKEADGSEQNMVIPYASLPVLLREGMFKYNITLGNYRPADNNIDKNFLSIGTFAYGVPIGFTLYGGAQLNSYYKSFAIGTGKNLGDIGALSFDITQAISEKKNSKNEKGVSFRVRYSKNFSKIGTDFSIAGYRYGTSGYSGMLDVLDSYRKDNKYYYQKNKKNKFEVNINQNLSNKFGSIFVSAISESYWSSNHKTESLGVYYNNNWKEISYSLNYVLTKNTNRNNSSNKNDYLLGLNINIPFSFFDSNISNNPYVSAGFNSGKNVKSSSLSVNGTLLEDNNLSWGVQGSYSDKEKYYTGSINTNWIARYGQLGGGYYFDKNINRINYNIQGGVIAHEKGVTFGQTMGDTVALVEVPDAKGVTLNYGKGIKTDYNGNAIVPYISPYKKNRISLNSNSFSDNTEVDITTKTVFPTKKAIVKVDYKTSIGKRALIKIHTKNGKVIPFGSILSTKNNSEFIVSSNGEVYVTGLDNSGLLNVKWGERHNEKCNFHYELNPKINSIQIINEICEF